MTAEIAELRQNPLFLKWLFFFGFVVKQVPAFAHHSRAPFEWTR
jgi:hypothetical protein